MAYVDVDPQDPRPSDVSQQRAEVSSQRPGVRETQLLLYASHSGRLDFQGTFAGSSRASLSLFRHIHSEIVRLAQNTNKQKTHFTLRQSPNLPGPRAV